MSIWSIVQRMLGRELGDRSPGRRYRRGELSEPGLLQFHAALPLIDDESRALFVGSFDRSRFLSFAEFIKFATNISSITQAWYEIGDLDAAYGDYYPPETEGDRDGELWLEKATESHGSLVEWLESAGLGVDLSQLPSNLAGSLHWRGSRDEFQLYGQARRVYFEAYVADRLGDDAA
jgi:hypothetical protein